MSCENLPEIVDIAKGLGHVVDKRIYGHGNMLNKFSDVIVKYAIEPKYCLKPIPGKDTADHKLIIDAVDIVRDGIVDVVCIASSDSDFRDLGIYIQSKGKNAIAICSNKNATKLAIYLIKNNRTAKKMAALHIPNQTIPAYFIAKLLFMSM